MNNLEILKKQEELLKEVDFLANFFTQNERKIKSQLQKNKTNI
ncbi:hypothetical protein [Clostridium sp. UBA2485]|nr:hypothetical protein [Clostridium sp. UBA2485]